MTGTRLPILAALMLGLVPGIVAAETYKISTSDVLRLRVLEWQPIDGTMREWEALAGEYEVGPDGSISVPFLGPVMAVGKAPVEVGAEISDGLKQRLALPDLPDATVEIAKYQPVIVSGHVKTPGEIVYRPGLTARQAIAMAGGPSDEIRRTPATVRDLISGQGALRINLDQLEALRVRKARLEAERDGRDDFTPVPMLEDTPRSQALVQEEVAFMALRRDQLARGLAAIQSQKELLEAEIESLNAKGKALETQIELGQREVENATNLSERGLVANARLFESQRTLSAIESSLLDVSTAVLRARQGVADAERDRIALIDTRSSEVALQLQEVEAAVLEAERRVDTERSLAISLMTQAQGTDLPVDGASLAAQVTVSILRNQDGATEEIPDAMDMALKPGDLIEMTLRPPSTN